MTTNLTPRYSKTSSGLPGGTSGGERAMTDETTPQQAEIEAFVRRNGDPGPIVACVPDESTPVLVWTDDWVYFLGRPLMRRS